MTKTIAQLTTMVEDMQEQSTLYKPTTFWIEASKIIMDEIAQKGIQDFRSHISATNMFVPLYAFPDYTKDKESFNVTKSALSDATQDAKSNIKLDMLLRGETQAFCDYRVLSATDRNYPPYTDKVSESSIGTPLEQFEFNNRKFSRSFLNYLLGLNFLKQYVDTSNVKTVMEIGGGFGTLGEILLSEDRNECFYINADIPPVSFVSSYYLKELLGKENVADYFDLKEHDSLSIAQLSEQYKAINISSWQIPKLAGKIDLFVNFISFQEMEPEVVQNYCDYISKLNPEFILLRNIEEGKKKQDKEFLYGVKTPVLGVDYDTYLSNYELLASDGEIFGFKTEDNFHSQLRVYKRK